MSDEPYDNGVEMVTTYIATCPICGEQYKARTKDEARKMREACRALGKPTPKFKQGKTVCLKEREDLWAEIRSCEIRLTERNGNPVHMPLYHVDLTHGGHGRPISTAYFEDQLEEQHE